MSEITSEIMSELSPLSVMGYAGSGSWAPIADDGSLASSTPAIVRRRLFPEEDDVDDDDDDDEPPKAVAKADDKANDDIKCAEKPEIVGAKIAEHDSVACAISQLSKVCPTYASIADDLKASMPSMCTPDQGCIQLPFHMLSMESFLEISFEYQMYMRNSSHVMLDIIAKRRFTETRLMRFTVVIDIDNVNPDRHADWFIACFMMSKFVTEFPMMVIGLDDAILDIPSLAFLLDGEFQALVLRKQDDKIVMHGFRDARALYPFGFPIKMSLDLFHDGDCVFVFLSYNELCHDPNHYFRASARMMGHGPPKPFYVQLFVVLRTKSREEYCLLHVVFQQMTPSFDRMACVLRVLLQVMRDFSMLYAAGINYFIYLKIYLFI